MIIFSNKEAKNVRKIDILNRNIVGVLLNHDISLLSAIYSCYKNGITYIPLDPGWPNERINTIISANNLEVVITTQEYQGKINDSQAITVDNDHNVEVITRFPENEISYILYTSGSTGEPKGVKVKRKSLMNFIDGVSERIDFSYGKRIACLTAATFDIFFLESVMALEKDMTVVLANENEQYNPKLMAKLIRENNVDMIQMTPSRMQLLLNYDKELSCLSNVKEIMIGGEAFPLTLLYTLQKKTAARIYNMYGPTETTIWSTISDLTNKERIDIGYPIKNTEIYIVDGELSILPDGQEGEICIAGEGLAKGYVGSNDLTKEKFVYLPQKPGVKVYRTGDMGRYLSDGDLEYLGRTDNQIKIRGHRIELEEIEAYLNRFTGVNQSVVIAIETTETDKVLEAFYVCDNYIDTKDIISYLSLKLPDYMIPAKFKRVESFIQTANGKIDRKRVLECMVINAEESLSKDCANELNALKTKIFNVIVSILNSEMGDVNIDLGFSDIGVDSIIFIKIVVALESEFDFEFDDELLQITAFPTIKSMIEYVETKIDNGES